jgi:hypothetical protein
MTGYFLILERIGEVASTGPYVMLLKRCCSICHRPDDKNHLPNAREKSSRRAKQDEKGGKRSLLVGLA